MSRRKIKTAPLLTALSVALLLTLVTTVSAEPKASLLLSPAYISKAGVELNGAFDLSPGGQIVLGTKDNLLDLRAKKKLLNTSNNKIDSFALTGDGALITISNGKLGFVKNGKIEERVTLPNEVMKVVKGFKNQLLLFGGSDIYIYSKGGKYQKLASVKEQITAATAAGDTIYFSAGSTIYSITNTGGSLVPVLVLSRGTVISSLGYESASKTLYFTSNKALYALSDSGLSLLGKNAGGEIKVQGGSVYILSPERGQLVRLQME
ncbi:MAG: hypothetical protein V3T30_02475 [Thermodesulfobacteriota bacterium]